MSRKTAPIAPSKSSALDPIRFAELPQDHIVCPTASLANARRVKGPMAIDGVMCHDAVEVVNANSEHFAPEAEPSYFTSLSKLRKNHIPMHSNSAGNDFELWAPKKDCFVLNAIESPQPFILLTALGKLAAGFEEAFPHKVSENADHYAFVDEEALKAFTKPRRHWQAGQTYLGSPDAFEAATSDGSMTGITSELALIIKEDPIKAIDLEPTARASRKALLAWGVEYLTERAAKEPGIRDDALSMRLSHTELVDDFQRRKMPQAKTPPIWAYLPELRPSIMEAYCFERDAKQAKAIKPRKASQA